jgi:spermidine synthase
MDSNAAETLIGHLTELLALRSLCGSFEEFLLQNRKKLLLVEGICVAVTAAMVSSIDPFAASVLRRRHALSTVPASQFVTAVLSSARLSSLSSSNDERPTRDKRDRERGHWRGKTCDRCGKEVNGSFTEHNRICPKRARAL